MAVMRYTLLLCAVFSITLVLCGGCSTAPSSVVERQELVADAAQTVKHAMETDSGIKIFVNSAAGYAVFPSIGKGAIGLGGAYGRGVVYEKGTLVGYCDLSQGTIGFQLGGQAYSELIFFQTQEALAKFKAGDFAFAAQATAVALKSGAGANAEYSGGVLVFTLQEAGLMYEASIGGQQFTYVPK